MLALVLAGTLALGHGVAAAQGGTTETVGQALCRLIEVSAKQRDLPVSFLTRLMWQESGFRTTAISPVGAQGVAQFMPGTAQERGLADPFDPEQAIPAAASFLAELADRFGNLGLAAAAYNGGPNRVALWLDGKGGLPAETRDYVARITGRGVEDWAAQARAGTQVGVARETPGESCLKLTANLRVGTRIALGEGPLAPWGIQLAGNFSKEIALASFARARQAYSGVLGEVRPMVIGTRLRSRGLRAFYRVRVPAATRDAANKLCDRIRALGGSCIVLPS